MIRITDSWWVYWKMYCLYSDVAMCVLCPNFRFIHCARSTIEEVSIQLMPHIAKNLNAHYSVISKNFK